MQKSVDVEKVACRHTILILPWLSCATASMEFGSVGDTLTWSCWHHVLLLYGSGAKALLLGGRNVRWKSPIGDKVWMVGFGMYALHFVSSTRDGRMDMIR
jgi:hypothetical protein